jgi:hypothetical protein
MSIVRNVSNVHLVDVFLHFLRFNWGSRKRLKEGSDVSRDRDLLIRRFLRVHCYRLPAVTS